ncbi:hypothetical protein Bca52824_096005 [Brassica carinata]|uniref:Uncharacterized protein n=1 Tax=Brassica carinata TaxID=52824 RepID=A0A8X7P2C3_BRACI|nr:hypothetical protein Bca52824_096005 [Brassica carinata]
MTAPLRTSPRLVSKPGRTQLRLLEETQKSFSVFNLRCYSLCPCSSPFFHATAYNNVCKHANLRLLTRSPLITLRCYTEEMRACLKAGNADAHFIEGVKQYFELDQPTKGLRHLKLSAKNNHRLGTSLCYSSNDHMGT